MTGEFGIVYKGYLAGQYTNEIVAIKTLKGMNTLLYYHSISGTLSLDKTCFSLWINYCELVCS